MEIGIMQAMGTLYVVATPIGNLADISIRAIETLFSVDIIACEDTRRAGMLLSELEKRYPALLPERRGTVHPTLVRIDNHTEYKVAPELLQKLEEDLSVALISDGGTPRISDPGYILVTEALKHAVPVTGIPGPTAVTDALSISPLPTSTCMFHGYPPEKQGHRVTQLENILKMSMTEPVTHVWYVSPHKIEGMMRDISSVMPGQHIVIARELTKLHESIWQGKVENIFDIMADIKGEIVLLMHVANET